MSENLSEFGNHLEFGGYGVSPLDKGFRATHDSYLNFVYRPVGGGVLLTVYFNMNGSHDERVEFCNNLNREAVCARFLVDKDEDFAMEGWFPGTYDRKGFAAFLDGWQRDGTRLMQHPDARTRLQ